MIPEEIDESNIKFSTCKNRSDEEIERTIRRCSCQGGDIQMKGFFCVKVQIFPLDANVCNDCPFYESK